MPTENVFVRGENNSNFEGMTKEQILAAIVQIIESGTVGDVDTGFVTTIKEQNNGLGLKFWVGTSAEYEALPTKENNVLYIKTDDTSAADISTALQELQNSSTEHGDAIAALQDQIDGANAYYVEASGLSETITDLISDAEAGLTVYDLSGASVSNGFPVNVPISTQSSNKALLAIFKSSAAMVVFEYEGHLYYAHYYTNPQGVQMGKWIDTNPVTSIDNTTSLSTVVSNAKDGFTVYFVSGNSDTSIYPVVIPVGQNSNCAVVTITKVHSTAKVEFEYEGQIYICHCYTSGGSVHVGGWYQVTTTAV